MTRTEILNSYDVDEHGIIQSPGKFEGEMIYIPHYWDAYLSGFVNRDDGQVCGFDITKEDRAEFPELGKRRRTVELYQRDDGFVCEV